MGRQRSAAVVCASFSSSITLAGIFRPFVNFSLLFFCFLLYQHLLSLLVFLLKVGRWKLYFKSLFFAKIVALNGARPSEQPLHPTVCVFCFHFYLTPLFSNFPYNSFSFFFFFGQISNIWRLF